MPGKPSLLVHIFISTYYCVQFGHELGVWWQHSITTALINDVHMFFGVVICQQTCLHAFPPGCYGLSSTVAYRFSTNFVINGIVAYTPLCFIFEKI